MTDQILQTATELTKHTKPRYQPIAGRVAYVVSHGQSYASNGYAIRTHGIAKALNGHGLETLCFVRPGRPWDMGIAKNTVKPEMVIDGVRYIHSRWPRDKKPGSEEQKFTATVSRLVELFTIYRPQVVIAASNHEIALPALVAARQLGLPFQYEVRGFWEVSRASRDPGWENSEEYREHYDRESYIISRADQLYTLNTQMKHELVARGAKPENIDLVPNSVSGMPTVVTQSNVRQQHRIPKDAYVLGYMGAITEYEGLDHLIEALALLKKENVYALIVGGYSPVNRLGRAKPEPIVQKLQKLAKSHGIHKQVIFTGRVDYHKLPEYFAAVDATVIPRAPLPVCELVSALKPLEYLSYGKPLIASNVAPQAEVLEQGKLGWLYEKGDAQSLADTVRSVRGEEGKKIQVKINAGRQAVNQRYQWQQTTAVMVERLKPSAEEKPEVINPQEKLEERPREEREKAQEETAPTATEASAAVNISKEPVWFDFSVEELVPHTVSGEFEFSNPSDISKRACIARIEYQDHKGNLIPGPYSGIASSKKVGPFSYLNVSSDKLMQVVPPMGAKKVAFGVQAWNAEKPLKLVKPLQCISQLASDVNGTGGAQVSVDLSTLASKRAEAPARALADIKIAAILDEFTMECFRHEVQLTTLTPKNWEAELEASQPDMLFVESCWFGNGNQWSGLIYGYTSNGPNKMDDLINVIAYCRKKGIPTVFWAKEDPVHFKRFGPTAKLFDYVYTTDANMVKAYKKDFGIDAEPLSFFCQPRVHNPSPVIDRNGKAAFAGSYYSDKVERCENFHSIMQGLEQAGVDYDIYDRCLKRGVAHLQFPEHFKKHVVGYLEPHEMWKAYKGYRYTVNLNTVKHSPTMFARRVYESLASGTPVISNYSEGVVTQFGGLVCASDNQKDVVEYLNRLRDPAEYQAISEQGVRETLGHHTLADRLEQVCERLGIPVTPHLPIANAVYTAGTEAEVEQARAHFQQQGYHHKRLVVNLKNSNVLYPYLNQNSEEEIFRVLTEFAKPLQGIDVPMTINSCCPATLLEDEAIKTQYQRWSEAVQAREAAV